MLSHMTLRVSDIDTTREFYKKTLAPLGYSLEFDKNFDGVQVIGFSKEGVLDTWFTTNTPVSGPSHFAYKANSKEEVDAFHKVGLEAGGKDNGKPGLRPEYAENYYGAFILDPDGNNIEAVFFS